MMTAEEKVEAMVVMIEEAKETFYKWEQMTERKDLSDDDRIMWCQGYIWGITKCLLREVKEANANEDEVVKVLNELTKILDLSDDYSYEELYEQARTYIFNKLQEKQK